MGFNIFRFLTEPQYRAIKRWKGRKGDDTLMYDFQLSPESLVIDAGCYRGTFARRISERGQPKVLAFEPAPAFYNDTKATLADLPNVTLECAGLSDFNGESILYYDNDGSSTQRRSQGDSVTIRLRRASDVMREIDGLVDVMKLNIEGDEYPVLENLLSENMMPRIKHLIVQFHLIDSSSHQRYEAISKRLAETHKLAWRYPFIWERWDLM